MRGELTRGKLAVALAAGAVAFGAAAWLLLGPVWAIAGAFLGPLVAVVVVAGVRAFTTPDAATLLDNDQPGEAIARLRNEIPSWRALARIWPSQFRDALANRLIVQSGALQAVHRDEEALRTAGQAVAIYQDLAASRPGKYGPDLAGALDHQSRLLAADDRPADALAAMQVAVRLYRNLAAADARRYLPVLAESLDCQADWLAQIGKDSDATAAAHEATAIYQDRLPSSKTAARAARGMLLDGELLCRQGRYREAAKLLAQGWHTADPRHQQDALWQAAPTLRAAYRADPDNFVAVWHAETGGEPPNWVRR